MYEARYRVIANISEIKYMFSILFWISYSIAIASYCHQCTRYTSISFTCTSCTNTTTEMCRYLFNNIPENLFLNCWMHTCLGYSIFHKKYTIQCTILFFTLYFFFAQLATPNLIRVITLHQVRVYSPIVQFLNGMWSKGLEITLEIF